MSGRAIGRVEGNEGIVWGELFVCAVAEFVHSSADDQRHPGGDWTDGSGGGQRDLCAGAGLASGCYPDSYVDFGRSGGDCKSGGACLDMEAQGAAFGAMAEAGDWEESAAVGTAAGGAGYIDADSGGAGDVDASHGASDGNGTGSAD